MYNELIYDFDGTLSDSYPIFAKVFLELLKKHGIESDYDTVYSQLKVTIAHTISCYDWGEFDRKAIAREFHDMHEAIALEEQKPLPGAMEILEFAIKNGKRNYLYTRSGGIATELIKKWGMYDHFTYIIDANSKFPPKPKPDALNWLCEEYNLDKSKSLMIGDRALDTDSGANAGMKSCMFDPEGYYTQTPADHRINDLLELEDIMMGKH